MKIHQVNSATISKRLAVNGVFFLFLALIVRLAIDRDAHAVAVGLYVFLAVGFVVLFFRLLSLPGKCWVEVTSEKISWRAPGKPRRFVTPTGSVPLAAVAGFEVMPQQLEMRKGRPLNGETVRLTLTDGGTVTLPLWCSALRRTQPFEVLLAQLRSATKDHTNRADATP
ncbi:hypothetical protein [Rugosimonospora africana]|uniref:Uncharacterized protein n=1 Tax=Rugosimonospora africana TaxID=556532 RepID=A0A8J3QZK4_9ACTN|nr:hypothetical protein [Rugosimonospora africana]GIH18947.1 hypothetical protein Raf01_71190 [Rugosimonospora africana]